MNGSRKTTWIKCGISRDARSPAENYIDTSTEAVFRASPVWPAETFARTLTSQDLVVSEPTRSGTVVRFSVVSRNRA